MTDVSRITCTTPLPFCISDRPRRLVLAACLLTCLIACDSLGPAQAAEAGRTFYVSAATGDDRGDGRSPQSPWKSLEKVNTADLQPGDKVLFRRGDVWRGTLIPHSGREGAPITYGAYGEGEKPLLLGSVSRNNPGDWHREGDHLWATSKPSFAELASPAEMGVSRWSVHAEGGANVKTSVSQGNGAEAASLQIQCTAGGAANHHLQLGNREIPVVEGDFYVFAFRARCTKPFAIPQVTLIKQSPPWTGYADASGPKMKVDATWTDCSVRFKATHTARDGRITIYLGGALPAGSTFSFQPVSLKRLRPDATAELSRDVGNLLFDHGKAVGVKKWKADDLRRQGDYLYCRDTWQVKVFSDENPAILHKSVELALCRHIVDQGGKGYVVYEDLSLQCGAAHGIGGGNTHHIVVRRCDLGWIGGGHQFSTPDGHPVRYGNAIEFWENARDSLVEGCRIWEVYDAALTNQGGANNSQVNLVYRDNVIWNCEYSFEYWNRGPESTTRNIRFEHNTCYSAGFGWGHAQRPDPNGRHLMFYVNSAQTSDVRVCNNIFSSATDSCLRMENDWTAGLAMDHNCWHQPRGPLASFLNTQFSPTQFADYQKRTGKDLHSIAADPKFVDPAKLDFRLSDDSPARSLAPDGSPAGARQRLEK
jgi:hypothetical protein